jgi:hypothetical protein
MKNITLAMIVGTLVLGLSCSKGDDSGRDLIIGVDPGPTASWYDDKLPSPRPGSRDVAFIRGLGGLDSEARPEPGLYLYEQSTQACRLLLAEPVQRAAWLDSIRLVVPRGVFGEGPLYALDVESGLLSLLEPTSLGSIAVDPLGGRIAFEKGSHLGIFDVATTQITMLPGGGYLGPTWHPTAESLTVPRVALSGFAHSIVSVSLRGTVLAEITSPKANHQHLHPSWTPTGSVLAYEWSHPRAGGTVSDIALLVLSNSNRTIVAEGRYPAFSSSDPPLLYFSRVPESQSYGLRLHVYDLETGGVHQLFCGEETMRGLD